MLKSTIAPTNKTLTIEQENAICKYIERLNEINMCAHPQIIVKAANYLMHFENCVVVHQWLKQFFEQNSKYHIQKQKFLAKEQKQNHSVHDMDDYYKRIEQVIREKKIIKLDVWNIDETSFEINCGKIYLIIIIDSNKPLCIINLENCNYIILV